MWRRRADGVLVRNVPNNRRVMPYLMRGRNESAVYFRLDCDLKKTDAFIRAWNLAAPTRQIDVFHLSVWALAEALKRNPTVHRFTAGGRLYDRDGIWFSYVVKTKLADGAPFRVVKRRFDLDATFGAMVDGMYAEQARVMAGEIDTVDRELGLLMAFPGFIRRFLMACVRGLDKLGMLPRGYIEKDPMYASAFFANMASFGMPAVYHHLYEYGTAVIFCSVGRPTTVPGSPTSGPDRRRTMSLKFTYDERAEEGLNAWFTIRRIRQIVEDPLESGIEIEPGPDVTPPSEPAVASVGATVDLAP